MLDEIQNKLIESKTKLSDYQYELKNSDTVAV